MDGFLLVLELVESFREDLALLRVRLKLRRCSLVHVRQLLQPCVDFRQSRQKGLAAERRERFELVTWDRPDVAQARHCIVEAALRCPLLLKKLKGGGGREGVRGRYAIADCPFRR